MPPDDPILGSDVTSDDLIASNDVMYADVIRIRANPVGVFISSMINSVCEMFSRTTSMSTSFCDFIS